MVIGRVAALLTERRRAVAVVLVLITLALASGLPRLKFETSQDTLVNRDSTVAKQNRRYQALFGGEAMLVAWTGDITNVTTSGNLARLRTIEDDLRATKRFDAVLGPVTALKYAQAQVAIAPAMFVRAGKTDVLAKETTRVLAAGDQSLDNARFVDFLLYGTDGSIRPALRDNFPDPHHLLMLVRLRGNADIASQGKAAADIERIVQRHPL